MADSMVQLINSQHLIPPGSTVLCAVSGGADSVYLLHRLNRLREEGRIRLAAAHYNHSLRGEESLRDEVFVGQVVSLCCCGQRVLRSDGQWAPLPPVELVVGRGDVAGESARTRRGLEETARAMRYAFLEQAAQQVGAELIATAHTADDNAETLLLHLVRGSGLRGLGGISPQRGALIRPLLTTSRQEIEQYLRYHGIPWREDASNRDVAYTRNRLRHQVMPVLKDINPALLQRLSDTTTRLREDEAYLTQLARDALGELHPSPHEVTVSARRVAQLPRPLALRATRILIGSVTRGNDNCTAAHLEALVALCASDAPSAQLNLPGGLTARRMYQQLLLSRSCPTPLSPLPLSLSGETWAGDWQLICTPEVYVGQTGGPLEWYLSQQAAPHPVVRPRMQGDVLRLPNRPGKRLKKWLIDEKIPAALRDSLPVLAVEGQVAAVALLGADQAFLPQMGELVWHIQCTPPLNFSLPEKSPPFEGTF